MIVYFKPLMKLNFEDFVGFVVFPHFPSLFTNHSQSAIWPNH